MSTCGPSHDVQDRCGLNAVAAHLRRRPDQAEQPTHLVEGFVIVAAAHVDDVGRVEVARAAEQRYVRPVQPDRRREILAREAGALRRVAWMTKVGVPVDVDQAVTARAPQREAHSEQQAAITAQHERPLAGLDQRTESVGEPSRVVEDGVLVAQPTR